MVEVFVNLYRNMGGQSISIIVVLNLQKNDSKDISISMEVNKGDLTIEH